MRNENDQLYFEVTGGAIMAAIEAWRKEYREGTAARTAFMREFGSTEALVSSGGIIALKFEDKSKVPTGWIKVKKHGSNAYVPGKTTEELKRLKIRMNGIRCPSNDLFQALCGAGPLDFFSNMCIRTMGFESYGSTFILTVPKMEAGQWNSPDEYCTPLKTSEYWKIREEFDRPPNVRNAGRPSTVPA